MLRSIAAIPSKSDTGEKPIQLYWGGSGIEWTVAERREAPGDRVKLESRTSEYEGPDRRRSVRRRVRERIRWCTRRDPSERGGEGIERSLDGLVFLVPANHVPRPGRRIEPSIRRSNGSELSVRSVLIKRTQRLSDGLCRVAAQIEA